MYTRKNFLENSKDYFFNLGAGAYKMFICVTEKSLFARTLSKDSSVIPNVRHWDRIVD